MTAVVVAYPHEESVSHSWHASLWALRDYESTREGGPRLHPNTLALRCNTGRLVQIRNYACRLFLDRAELADTEWLWMCDTDMGFQPDLLDQLLAAADPEAAPVVGALCFAMTESIRDGMHGFRFRIVPTMYMLGTTTVDGTEHGSFCFYGPYPADTVVEVAGTGAACLLIHRSVLEQMRTEWGDKWFDQIADSRGSVIGEDLSFCLRVRSLGKRIFVHTGAQTSHHKQVWITEEDYNQTPLVLVDQDGEPPPDLPVYIDLSASLATLARNDHMHPDGMRKLPADLDRYERLIGASHPQVIVETGSATGASARGFARQGLDVISVDIAPAPAIDLGELADRVTWVTGDSADPEVAARVAALVDGRRCMVSLDSDHSAPHVAQEIELYGRLVTLGCYLVVEDAIFGYAPDPIIRQHGLTDMVKSPLEAIAAGLVDAPSWSRDVAIERQSPISHHPAGWWLRTGVAE